MRKILVISANLTTEPFPVYPLGIAVIASALRSAGHTVAQFDFLAAGGSEDALRTAIASFAPDFACISLRNLDNCDSLSLTSYPAVAKRLVEVVREATAAPVIIGGPAFSIMPDALLDYTGADYGIVGEGERLVCELIHDLDRGMNPPRIQHGLGLLSGAEMCSPLLDDQLVRYYVDRSGMVNLQTKRGCPHACIYCSYPTLEGERYRCRNPENVVDDLEKIVADHGVNSFFFTDSVFNDGDGHYLQVVEEILRRNLAIRWCCYLRPEGIGRKELALMKRSGLYALEVGTDAASDTTLHSLGKGFSFADALGVSNACVAERIPCAHFVMFGGPGETEATVREGLDNIALLADTVVFAFSGIRILPHTPLHKLAVREGVIREDTPLLEPVYYHSPLVAPETVNELITASFHGKRTRVFPPSEGQKRLAIMHRFGYRGLLWDTLVPFRDAGTAPAQGTD